MTQPAAFQRHPVHTARVASGLAALLLLLPGVAPPLQAADRSGSGGPYARVLIVGVTPDADVRCLFEQFLADQVRSEATTPIQSCDVVKPLQPLTQAGIEQAVAAQQADAVLATILVASSARAVEGGDMDSRGGDYFKAEGTGIATDFWGLYGVPVVYGQFEDLPSVVSEQSAVTVETRVYDTGTKALVRSVISKAKHLESGDQAVAAITERVADQLRREGIVR